MKFPFLCAAALLALSAPAAAQSLTVEEALAIKTRAESGAFGGRAEAGALVFYLQGVAEGAMGYHQTLRTLNKSTAFCAPEGESLSLSMENLFAMLEDTPPAERSSAAAEAIVKRIGKKYPCTW